MVSSRQVLSSLLVASLALAAAQTDGASGDAFIAESVSMDGPSGSMDEPSGPPSGSMDEPMVEETLIPISESSSADSLSETEAVTIPPVPIGPLCSVYPLCKASDLEGNCCPSDDGEMLSCCMGVLDEDEDLELDDTDDEPLSGDEGPAMTTGSVGGMDTPVDITVGEVTYFDLNETLSDSEDLLDDLGPPTVAPTTTYAPTEMGTTGAPTDTFQPTWGGSGTYAPTKMVGEAPPYIPFTSSEDTTAAETDADADAVATPSSAARISTSLVTVAVALGALLLC